MGCPGRWQELGWKEGSWRRPCTGPKNTSTWFSVSEGHLNFKLSPTKELPKIPQKLRSAWRTRTTQKASLLPEFQFYQSPAEIERSILANLRQKCRCFRLLFLKVQQSFCWVVVVYITPVVLIDTEWSIVVWKTRATLAENGSLLHILLGHNAALTSWLM